MQEYKPFDNHQKAIVGMSQVGAMGGGIATEQALKNAYPRAVTQKGAKENSTGSSPAKPTLKKSKVIL